VCGKHGACSLYDADTFRQYFLGEFREDERQKINNITSFDYKLWSLAFNRISLVKEVLKLFPQYSLYKEKETMVSSKII